MNKLFMILVVILSSAAALAGCGSGGGGIAVAPSRPTTATTKMYLFGTISSASALRSAGVIDSIQTTITIPADIIVNYTPLAVAGDPPNTFRLQNGFVVSSGPATISADNISGSYNTLSRQLTISILNSGGTVNNLLGSTTDNGQEVATINFTHTAGVTPTMPSQDLIPVVKQFRTIPPGTSINYLNGCAVNFTTTYH